MTETITELARRVDELEAVILKLVQSAARRDVEAATAPLQARQDRRVAATQYEIASLIG